MVWCFFFFKQKTAYEIKECDWSSDVCSSDLTRWVPITKDSFCWDGRPIRARRSMPGITTTSIATGLVRSLESSSPGFGEMGGRFLSKCRTCSVAASEFHARAQSSRQDARRNQPTRSEEHTSE